MKVNIERPGEIAFGALRQGALFEHDGGIYCCGKNDSMTATVIYKRFGHMNAGDTEKFDSETIVRRIVEVSFKVG